MPDTATLSPQVALVYVMVLVSAADREMTDNELRSIGDIVTRLPVFRDYDADLLPQHAASCADILAVEDGLEAALGLIETALPARLHETAYAVACDVAAADGRLVQEELRFLEMLRYRLGVDRLAAAAIERGARARHTVA